MSTRRYHNYYGQEKWSFISNLNLKVRNIGDFMYEDNNLVWDDALTVDKPNPFPFKYFQDIRSKAPLIQGQNPCVTDIPYVYYDCPDARYWEIGFFYSGSSQPGVDPFYFLAVNKRCTPNLNNHGDLRELEIKFRASQLPYYNTWLLTEPMNDDFNLLINKNSSEFYNVGLFQPGEGRLFKLTPVMKSGGILVGNETIPAGSEFHLRRHCMDKRL